MPRLALVFLLLFSVFGTAISQAETNVLFIVDASGSMKKKVGDTPRMDIAKQVLGDALKTMPADVRLGLMAYGHRKPKDCNDIELSVPIGGEDASVIAATVAGLEAKGETPIAESLKKAAKSFNAFKGQQNSIILVTDGVEECAGDPCAAAQALKDAGLDVKVNIVGFTLGDAEGKALQCVTEITGGKYFAAADTAGLTTALQQAQAKVQETPVVQKAEPKKADNDILAAENGGTLVYAPNEMWQKLNHDHAKFAKESGATYTGEAVWSFRDGKPATFSQIDVLVQEQYQYNLKDFDVLAADELAGPYRALGAFTVQNVKMMPEGWQGFTFPETTARFVKVIFKTDQGGGYIHGNALRLIGKLDETAVATTAVATTAPAPADDVDILAQANGGTLVYAPNENWLTLNTGHFKRPTYWGEAVWHFRDGKPATFNRIGVQVIQSESYTLKTMDVLASDTLEGPYRALGTFTVQNVKVMPDGWQVFAFPAATARYVKVNFREGYGDYIAGHPLRLMGKIDDAAAPQEKPAPVEGTNILAQAAGGTLLMSPRDEWAQLNDGKEDMVALAKGEGVWAFAGEKPALFDTIDVLLPKAQDLNMKTFDVLVGDEGPTGTFRSVGTFTTQNTRVMPDGYQRFRFPKVQAKYLKIGIHERHGTDGSYPGAFEIRVIGNVGE